MKKIFLISFLLSILFIFSSLISLSLSAPNNSISIPYSHSPNTVISSSEDNANLNEVQTKYNAHSHADLTQVGTVTSGTWQGTAIDEAYGGTGSNFSATAQGNIFYFSGTGTIAALAPGTTDYPLVSNGSGANPAYEQLATAGIANLAVTNAKIAASTIDLTAKVTGVLPVANGGTNSTLTQAGRTSGLSSGGTFTYPSSFGDTNYTLIITGESPNDSASSLRSRTATGFTVYIASGTMVFNYLAIKD